MTQNASNKKLKESTKARERIKAQIKKDDQQRVLEDAKWAETDPAVLRKQQRKNDQLARKEQHLKRKQNNRLLFLQETESANPSWPLQRDQKDKFACGVLKSAVAKTDKELPLEENLNGFLDVDGYEQARNVSDAISILGDKKEDSEKRAFVEFQENRLRELKAQHPTLRLSQMKQMVKKEWAKRINN